MTVTIQIPVTITIPAGAPVCCCGEMACDTIAWGLYPTGYQKTCGDAEPHWTGDLPIVSRYGLIGQSTVWPDATPATWISVDCDDPNGFGATDEPPGVYTSSLAFSLTQAVLTYLQSTGLSVVVRADNWIKHVKVNGTKVAECNDGFYPPGHTFEGQPICGNSCIFSLTWADLTDYLVLGVNTVEVSVENCDLSAPYPGVPPYGGPTGMAAYFLCQRPEPES